MNPVLSLSMRILAFICTVVTASAFVSIQCTSTGGIISHTPHPVGICRMTSTAEESNIPDKLMEEVWRYVKKPLISVGGKGATGKFLEQLFGVPVEQHQSYHIA